MDVVCEHAQKADLKDIMRVISDARAFLAEQGVNQWQGPFPDEQAILEDITQKQAFVFRQKGKVVAFVCVSLLPEKEYETPVSGAFLLQGSYATIHRNAVSADFRGKGISRHMFDVCYETAKKAGMKNIRIDTHEDNARMRHILEREGFSSCAVVIVGDKTPRIAYEKEL